MKILLIFQVLGFCNEVSNEVLGFMERNTKTRPPTSSTTETVPPEAYFDLSLEQMRQRVGESGARFAMTYRTFKEPGEENYRVRTIPKFMSLNEYCDTWIYECPRAQRTGRLCAKTVYYKYVSFKSFCQLEYFNCMERYEVFQVVHMGDCHRVAQLTQYPHYDYMDDFHLDAYYAINDW